MHKFNKYVIVILIIMLVISIMLIVYKIIETSKKHPDIHITNNDEIQKSENSIIENVLSNTIDNETGNKIIADNTIKEVTRTTVNEESKNSEVNTATSNKEKDKKVEKTNNQTQKKQEDIKKQETRENVKEENKKDSNEEKTNITQNNKPNNTDKKENNNQANSKLANTTYRKTNTGVIPEIINILDDEISKDTQLKEVGSKAIKGNKTDAYKNTNGFTYMFVKDIEKGKVKGNYMIFEQRVRNVVGAFGKYHVYAEDEFVYDAKGINSYWSQTLVWIYITF